MSGGENKSEGLWGAMKKLLRPMDFLDYADSFTDKTYVKTRPIVYFAHV